MNRRPLIIAIDAVGVIDMIEFNGELTGKCKKFLIKEQIKSQTVASLIVTFIFLVPTILIAIQWGPKVLAFFALNLLMVIFSLLPPSKKAQEVFMPRCVFFDFEEETVVYQNLRNEEQFRMISSIEQILDFGEWYYLKFEYSDRAPYFVCQKSLITQGTIEEFERVFGERIVIKY